MNSFTMHLIVPDPAGPIVTTKGMISQGGRWRFACDLSRKMVPDYEAKHRATGTMHRCVTCPGCKATAEYLALKAIEDLADAKAK